MIHRLLAVAIAALLSAAFVHAQPAPSRAQAVAPWVSDDTVWVTTAHLADVNLDVAGKWISDKAGEVVDPADLQEAQKGINQGLAIVRGLRDQLQAAGVTDVYAIYDVKPQAGDQLSIIIPAGANAQAVTDKLAPMVGRQNISVDQNAAVIRMNGNRIPANPAAARPDITAALSKSDAPVVMAITIPQEIRNMIPPQMPQQMGGGDLAPVQDGFTWACLDLRFTPAPAVHGVAQMEGANNARGAMDLIQKTMDAAAARPGGEGEAFTKLKQWFMPEVKDDQLVVDLSTDKINKAVADLGPSIRRAREQAKRIQSASQIRQLLMGVHMFASQNGGKTPDKLEDLDSIFGGPSRLMMNPDRPTQKPGYIYVKQPDLKVPNISDVVTIYEAHDTWNEGINVGYLDGHVEWVNDQARFQEQLKASGGQTAK